MANPEHLAKLMDGVEYWNNWRVENPEVQPDLSGIVLGSGPGILQYPGDKFVYLTGGWASFVGANLSKCNLSRTELAYVHLNGSDLRGADLSYTNLPGAFLKGSNLSQAKLWKADLSRADLSGCILSNANLEGANLREANLIQADLVGARLAGSDFSRAEVGSTFLGSSDLSQVIGLESVFHAGPSRIMMDIFALSKGKIPDVFLWGCGLSDWEIETVNLYNPELSNDEINNYLYRAYDFRANRAIQISPLFISYSRADSDFVDKVGKYMTKRGIRYWRDIHDMKAGRIEEQIDRAIRQNPTVLLVLSKNSLGSDWVEHEVRKARTLQKELGRDVFCPVALDSSWQRSSWPERLMEQVTEYNILDFSAWQDDKEFDIVFHKLLDGLELYYKA